MTYIADNDSAAVQTARVRDLTTIDHTTAKTTPRRATSESATFRTVKFLEDRVVAGLLLFCLSPMLAALALWIRLDSPGPVLFRQRRGGLHGRPFTCLKFRTMHVLEDGPAVPQARRGDPRVTRCGRFLRRTSLDELPQLVNVLRGEMSLVGPRPHALAHDAEFRALVPDYDGRFATRPGITGLAQVAGFRGGVEDRAALVARVAHDVRYARAWSPWMELRILLATPVVLLTGRNAF